MRRRRRAHGATARHATACPREAHRSLRRVSAAPHRPRERRGRDRPGSAPHRDHPCAAEQPVGDPVVGVLGLADERHRAGSENISRIESKNDTWLATTIAGPSAGRCSRLDAEPHQAATGRSGRHPNEFIRRPVGSPVPLGPGGPLTDGVEHPPTLAACEQLRPGSEVPVQSFFLPLPWLPLLPLSLFWWPLPWLPLLPLFSRTSEVVLRVVSSSV